MHRMLTAILACLGMVGALAIDTYLPSFAAIGHDFNVGPLAVQQTLSVFLATFAFMMLFHGVLSDSFGRRPVILVALAVFTAATVGAALATSFGALLVCRALQGLGAGAGSVIGQAIVQDRFKGAQAQKMMSQIMLVFGLAPAIAPILGGWLQVSFGWRATFVFLALFGAAMLVLCALALPESLPKAQRHAFRPGTIANNYLRVLGNRQFMLLSLTVALAWVGPSLYIGSAAHFVMVILGLPETAFAWLFVPIIGGMVIGSAWGGKNAGKVMPLSMMRIGYLIMGIGAALHLGYNLLFAPALPWAVLPLMVYTCGLAVAVPAIQHKALALLPQNYGLASSMIAFVQMMAFALVSGVLAPLLFNSALHLACGVAGGVALSFCCWRLSLRETGMVLAV